MNGPVVKQAKSGNVLKGGGGGEGGEGKTVGQFEGYGGVSSKSLSLLYTMAREKT